VSSHAEIVQRCYELLNRRDLAKLFEFLDPDIELDNSRLVFNPDVYRGRDGAERWMRWVDEVWETLRLTPTELTDVGDNVVAAVTIHGKGKESGVGGEHAAVRRLDVPRLEGCARGGRVSRARRGRDGRRAQLRFQPSA
jgi:ketosteroid isomerase-like protein